MALIQQPLDLAAVAAIALALVLVPAGAYRAVRRQWHTRGARLAFVCLSAGLEIPFLALLLGVLSAAGWLVLGGQLCTLWWPVPHL